VNERFPRPASEQAILPHSSYWDGKFSVNCLPDDIIHVTGSSGEYFGLLDLGVMFTAEAMLSHCQLVWLSKAFIHIYAHSLHSINPNKVKKNLLDVESVNYYICVFAYEKHVSSLQ
jgi:hypothetical protein